QNHTALEPQAAQMRRQQRRVAGGERRQEPVRPDGVETGGERNYAEWHRPLHKEIARPVIAPNERVSGTWCRPAVIPYTPGSSKVPEWIKFACKCAAAIPLPRQRGAKPAHSRKKERERGAAESRIRPTGSATLLPCSQGNKVANSTRQGGKYGVEGRQG